jgi:hypothetical protein
MHDSIYLSDERNSHFDLPLGFLVVTASCVDEGGNRQQLLKAPDMIRQPRSHRRRARLPTPPPRILTRNVFTVLTKLYTKPSHAQAHSSLSRFFAYESVWRTKRPLLWRLVQWVRILR